MMAVVPDTGGGLSGFIAHGLWKLYQYFPSSGRWDWLLLVFLLAVLVRILYLPLLWKSVKADMDLLRQGKAGASKASMLTVIWDVGSAFFLVWFFHTAAGRTFLARRSLGPDVVATGLFWFSLVWSGAAVMGCDRMNSLLNQRNKAIAPSCSAPYADRGLLSLFGGGGVFYTPGEEGEEGVVNNAPMVGIESRFFFLAHVFYWYWSIASVTIFSAFILSGVLTEIVRMVFVYILHKQVFG